MRHPRSATIIDTFKRAGWIGLCVLVFDGILEIIRRLFEHIALGWAAERLQDRSGPIMRALAVASQWAIRHPAEVYIALAVTFCVAVMVAALVNEQRNSGPVSRNKSIDAERPILVMQFPRGIKDIGAKDRDFWVLHNMGTRAATRIKIQEAHLGDYRLEFDDINALGPSGHGHDVARVRYKAFRQPLENFWGSNHDGFSNPAHGLKSALDSVADLADGVDLPLTITYQDTTERCVQQIIHYDPVFSSITVRTEECLKTNPDLAFEYQTIFRGSWAWSELQDPQVCYVRNRQLNIADGAKAVTARVQFSRINPKTTFTLTEAPWLPIKEQGPLKGTEVRSSVDLAGNEIQPFALLVKHADGTLCAHKGNAPIGLCDTGVWILKIDVVSENSATLKGIVDLTVTRDREYQWGTLKPRR